MRPAGIALLALLAAAGCKREERRFEEPAPASQPAAAALASGLHAGGPEAVTQAGPTPPGGAYMETAYAVSEGQRLYMWFNCVGCHAHGGGAIGPPLMDSKWIYGAEPQSIYNSIVEGRPNGMPSFRGKIPDQQVWQLVAYVRSLSGLTPAGTRSARPDNLSATPPPTLEEKPKVSDDPRGAEAPR